MNFGNRMLEIINVARIMIVVVIMVIFILIVTDVSGSDTKSSDFVKMITAGIGTACTAYFSLKYHQIDKDKELSLRYITEKRLDWINDTRELTSELCAYIAKFVYDSGVDKCTARNEIAGTLSSLYVRYNLNDENDRVLLDVLDYMYVSVIYFEKLEESCDRAEAKNRLVEAAKLLTIHSQIYLKVEWERVKLETTYSGDETHKDKIVKEKMSELRLSLYEQAVRDSKNNEKVLANGLYGLRLNEVYKKIKSSDENKQIKSRKKGK